MSVIMLLLTLFVVNIAVSEVLVTSSNEYQLSGVSIGNNAISAETAVFTSLEADSLTIEGTKFSMEGTTTNWIRRHDSLAIFSQHSEYLLVSGQYETLISESFTLSTEYAVFVKAELGASLPQGADVFAKIVVDNTYTSLVSRVQSTIVSGETMLLPVYLQYAGILAPGTHTIKVIVSGVGGGSFGGSLIPDTPSLQTLVIQGLPTKTGAYAEMHEVETLVKPSANVVSTHEINIPGAPGDSLLVASFTASTSGGYMGIERKFEGDLDYEHFGYLHCSTAHHSDSRLFTTNLTAFSNGTISNQTVSFESTFTKSLYSYGYYQRMQFAYFVLPLKYITLISGEGDTTAPVSVTPASKMIIYAYEGNYVHLKSGAGNYVPFSTAFLLDSVTVEKRYVKVFQSSNTDAREFRHAISMLKYIDAEASLMTTGTKDEFIAWGLPLDVVV